MHLAARFVLQDVFHVSVPAAAMISDCWNCWNGMQACKMFDSLGKSTNHPCLLHDQRGAIQVGVRIFIIATLSCYIDISVFGPEPFISLDFWMCLPRVTICDTSIVLTNIAFVGLQLYIFLLFCQTHVYVSIYIYIICICIYVHTLQQGCNPILRVSLEVPMTFSPQHDTGVKISSRGEIVDDKEHIITYIYIYVL